MSETQEELPVKRKALVRGTTIENIILAADDFEAPEGCRLVDDPESLAVINGACDEQGMFAPPPLVIDRAHLAAQIDAAVTAIYDTPIKLSEEYKRREAQARAFLAGTSGTAPRVQAYADAKGVDLTTACHIVVGQADALYAACDALGDLRMQKSYITREDVSDEDALARFNETMAQIDEIAASLN